MEESDEKKGVFDLNTIDQSTTTFIVGVDYAEVCRLCMQTIGTGMEDASAVTTVFTIYKDSLQFGHIAMNLANVKIDKNDRLPKKLCEKCRERLIQFYAFKRKCEETDRTLNKILHTSDGNLEVNESQCIKMYTASVDDYHIDGDLPVTEALENSSEKNVLESDCDAVANVENVELKCGVKKKKRKRLSKRVDAITADSSTKLHPMVKEKTRKVCEQCGLTFSSNCTLRRHRITHTGRKDYICDICQNGFARKFHLDMHMRIHLKIRPHICETCASSFSTSSDLSRHRRIHIDAKNYACVVCDRRFKRSSDVIKHMRSHTGQKPYACEAGACEKKYSSHSGLSKHLRRHHPQLVVQRVIEINEKKAKEQQIIERKRYEIDGMCNTNTENATIVATLPVLVP